MYIDVTVVALFSSAFPMASHNLYFTAIFVIHTGSIYGKYFFYIERNNNLKEKVASRIGRSPVFHSNNKDFRHSNTRTQYSLRSK